jgi:hypothetical protein
MAGRDWLSPVDAVLNSGFGGVMYCWMVYRWRLVPRGVRQAIGSADEEARHESALWNGSGRLRGG